MEKKQIVLFANPGRFYREKIFYDKMNKGGSNKETITTQTQQAIR